VIVLDALTKRFGAAAAPAVDRLSLEVRAGEFVALIGGSGCGKTTTLKMINRLVEPTSGSVLVDGDDVAEGDPVALRRTMGYVVQGSGLFPHMTVAQNIGVVPRLLGWEKPRIRARVDELLELVSLDPATFRDRTPRRLSGGQQQRVGVARALAAEQRILLMDEPFGALDPITRATLQDELKRLHEKLALTVIFVTHDMTEAMLLADRIAVLEHGKLIACDTPRALSRDAEHPVVRELIETPRREAHRIEEVLGDSGGPD
jgi:osmoprotectant transport system ATP-binding protein